MEKKLELKCHYCGSLNIVYVKKYNYEGVWVRSPNMFSSCSNEKCPYHFNLEGKHKMIYGEVEFIRYLNFPF